MGIEARPFLHRVEVRRRWKEAKATYREAWFEGNPLLIVRCGIGPNRAAASMRHLSVRPSAILSVGSAGSLSERLRIGDLVVASQTVFGPEPDRILTCPTFLVDAISQACRSGNSSHVVARLATAARPVFARDERLRLHELTGAMAVDMESHSIGTEAQKLGVPFSCLRVISDDLNSPPLPELRGLTKLWRRPGRFGKELAKMFRWRLFLRDFHRAVKLPAPVLVSLIRAMGKGAVSHVP